MRVAKTGILPEVSFPKGAAFELTFTFPSDIYLSGRTAKFYGYTLAGEKLDFEVSSVTIAGNQVILSIDPSDTSDIAAVSFYQVQEVAMPYRVDVINADSDVDIRFQGTCYWPDKEGDPGFDSIVTDVSFDVAVDDINIEISFGDTQLVQPVDYLAQQQIYFAEGVISMDVSNGVNGRYNGGAGEEDISIVNASVGQSGRVLLIQTDPSWKPGFGLTHMTLVGSVTADDFDALAEDEQATLSWWCDEDSKVKCALLLG